MNRRRFLATVSASIPLAFAGCLGDSDDEPSTTHAPTDDDIAETTDEPTSEPTTSEPTTSGPMSVGDKVSLGDDRAIGVVDTDATAFVVTRDGTDYQVHSGNTTRYVLITFDVDSVDDYESFVAENVTLTINGEETFTDPVFPLGGGSNRFSAAYPVPNDLTAYTSSVQLDADGASATWALGARYVEAITRDVDFQVSSVTTPDSVGSEADFGIDVEVENAASDPLEFYTIVEGTSSGQMRANFEVPGGETVTNTIDATAPAADGNSEFDVTLDWDADSVTKTIQFEE